MDKKAQSFQFRKTKLALAVSMTVSLAACGVDDDMPIGKATECIEGGSEAINSDEGAMG